MGASLPKDADYDREPPIVTAMARMERLVAVIHCHCLLRTSRCVSRFNRGVSFLLEVAVADL